MLARLVVLATLITAAPSYARGWRHTAPDGYAATANATFVQYMKSADGHYCLLALYDPRARTADDAAELAAEWRGVVQKMFAPEAHQTLPARTTRGKLRYATRTAPLVDGKGHRSYGELYVITARAAIGSLLAVSATAEAFEACRPAIAGVLDSLEEPAINQASLARAWAARGKDARALYTLEPDGTYRFRSERRLAADRWLLVDETGTWSIEPGRVTLKPRASTGVERTQKAVTATRKLPLEQVTYAQRMVYVEATDEWQLVLTPPKATARDGAFTADASPPRSYAFSDRTKLDWQF